MQQATDAVEKATIGVRTFYHTKISVSMIRLIQILAVLFFCTVTSAQAQISLGFTAGPNLSFREWRAETTDGNIIDLAYKPAPAFQTALFAEWKGSSVLSLRGEGGFQLWHNGLDLEVTDANGAPILGSATDELQSWTGGLLFKLTPFRKSNLYFLTGPSAAYLTKNRIRLDKTLAQKAKIERVHTIDLEQAGIEPVQYFLNAGAGTSFTTGTRGKVVIEARYGIGLSRLSTASNVDAHIHVLLLNLGYQISLGTPAIAQ